MDKEGGLNANLGLRGRVDAVSAEQSMQHKPDDVEVPALKDPWKREKWEAEQTLAWFNR